MSIDQVERDLEQMIALLETDEWPGWAAFFREALTLFRAGSHVECGRHILSGSGGMGSLNDIVLGQVTNSAGQFAWNAGAVEMNNKYQELLDRLYEFGHRVCRASSK